VTEEKTFLSMLITIARLMGSSKVDNDAAHLNHICFSCLEEALQSTLV
jgi:hypothetical protein